MRTALATVCAFTGLATAYLTLSLLILRPPNADVWRWSVMALLFVAQSAGTLLAIRGLLQGPPVRWVLLAGSAAIIWVGGSWAYATLAGSHFEGYAVVLGSALVVQGALTLSVFARLQPPPIAT